MSASCLPKLEVCKNLAEWEIYEEYLYSIFKADFLANPLRFNGKFVRTRQYPKINDREEAFYHITCKNYFNPKERDPDLRRCERIRWARWFIENYPKCKQCLDSSCSGIKIWKEPYKQNRCRYHLFLEDERYLVILEERSNYYLLITAYYIEYKHSFETQIQNYNKYKSSS